MGGTLGRILSGGDISERELAAFLAGITPRDSEAIRAEARARTDAVFGRRVFFRGLIEFTSYCAMDCYYCGLRRSAGGSRYRLSREQILACCEAGSRLGYRTFVLQGGEDAYFDDDRLCEIVASIRAAHPDCAITLSAGERSAESYRRLEASGANRYLLRHETADDAHFAELHPAPQRLTSRLKALGDLRAAGFQVGAGFMVGSPGQTPERLARDLLFLRRFAPEMAGIGPFIPHGATPFADRPAGGVEATLDALALTRLFLPHALIPATTALATVADDGRERGLAAGANVVMPNLSPSDVRSLYSIYDGKKSTGSEAAESLEAMKRELERAGFEPDMSRGDWRGT